MKKSLIILALLIISLSYSQEIKTIDPKLVGCWKGSEIDQQQKGVSKYWVACRFEDGKSTLLFIAINKKGEVDQHTENGKWWVENGKFYELHTYDGVVDVYEYEAIGDRIKFTGVDVMGDTNKKYTFFDYKIVED
jgi:hypothetical protein